MSEDELRRQIREDEKLLRRVEEALTEIKVAQGLSDQHASTLAALRIRLKGDAGKNLEDLLTAAGDLEPGSRLDELMGSQSKPKGSLDDLLGQKPKPKPEWPGP
jgi:hypothetical protein